MRNVVILGQGPGAYMCGIYAHTANLSPIIIKACKKSMTDFSGSEKVVGVKGIQSPEELVGLVERQSKNMGIEVREEEILNISKKQNHFEIETNTGTHETRSLVIDSKDLEKKYRPLLGGRGVFYVSDKAPYREAIILASAGCKVSFDVKEFIDAINQ
ncbi:thioredoxin reductase [Encephalitozoon romaleae SJ-2008]|uniref:Thioredoxin reductase n=1 Tax=Encephalitozoon romaleae (strain SJ-2008) TaxID=1178016 RepID=I6ZS20_ENCRO|nr:thioredoxin reductase [Encephalitozoon romaleae SJ-2008]AFN82391.1 thioredoxin reductase [Encephalitozoon romaleae SJ-2008]